MAERELVDELEKLRASSLSSVGVDSGVDDKLNQDKRWKLLQGLQMIASKLQKSLALGFVPVEKPLVRSHLSPLPPNGLTQDVEFSSVRLTLPVMLDGEKGLGAVDNRFDRTLIFDEFSFRFDILNERVSNGGLDDLLDYSAEVIVHAIMGQSGELLFRLGIEPMAGETYAMLDKEAHPVKMKPIYVDWEKPFRAIVEGVATAVKIRMAREAELLEAKPVPDGLGMETFPIDDQNVPEAGLGKGERGLLIINVFENSRAQRAGLRTGKIRARFEERYGYIGGDIIIGVEDQRLIETAELTNYLKHWHVNGTSIKLNILRNGMPLDIYITY